MDCEAWGEKLDLFLDNELDPADEAALRAHLKNCPECAADALDRARLKRTVRAAGRSYDPSAQLRSRIAASLANAPSRTPALTAVKAAPAKPVPTQTWGWRIAFACAALVLLIAVGWNYVARERLARQRVYSELADQHVATLASANPVDVVSSDRHTVKPWFQGRIPFTFNLPELQGTEFTLVGGRIAYVEQTAGAHLIFQVRKHEISVFIFPERALEVPSLPAGAVNALSFNTESWTHNGLRYFVVGDASPSDIAALGQLLRSVA